jgi:phage-related protein
MIAFPALAPSTTSNLQQNYNTLKAQFGGNYIQIAPNGINFSLATWNLEFDNRNTADSALLDAFLASVGTFAYFTWTPPSGSGTVWRIDDSVNSYAYQRTTNGLVNSYSFSVTQVY